MERVRPDGQKRAETAPDQPGSEPGSAAPTVALPAGLYVVATPLGNLGDMTHRAEQVLATVSCIACEDTRVTRELLRHLGIAPPPLLSVREHNEREAAAGVLARIGAGAAVAYASDAGTPAISDPGARLVAAVRAANFPIIPVPGVSAVTAALSVAGLESTAFTFLGFAPTGKGELANFVAAIAARSETSVCFESPHRIEKTLHAFASALPAERRLVIARELTKKFETVSALTAAEITDWLATNQNHLRGEFVLVVAGSGQPPRATTLDGRTVLQALLPELPPARAAKLAAKLSGEDRETLYALAESWRRD